MTDEYVQETEPSINPDEYYDWVTSKEKMMGDGWKRWDFPSKLEWHLTKYQIRVLRKICKKLVLQGPDHKERIECYYRIMYEMARCEFTEDNEITLKSFLHDCFDEALDEK